MVHSTLEHGGSNAAVADCGTALGVYSSKGCFAEAACHDGVKPSGQTGLAKRMAKLYIPAQALQGYIIGRLGRRVEPTTMCASFDDGAKLHAEHGGKGLLAQTCWQCHPGLCVTLDAPILEPCLTFAQRLVSYVRRIGAASQRYLMFVRQIGDLRKHVLVLMAGSSLISSGPRVVYFGQKITELKSPRVRRNTLKCMPCGGAEDHGMHVYHQELLSHHMVSQGFALESAVKCQHLSRPRPRLGLQEPAWLTQFSLAKCLQLGNGPAVHWACYEATCVNKCGRAGATIVLSDWKYVDLACGGGKAVRPSMAKQKSLDEALKTLPKDAVLTQDMLTMLSALRRTSKTTSGDKPHNVPKRTFKRINAGEKSEDSDSSDGVTEATSDSDDGAGQQIVKNAKAKRKAAKRRKQGGDIGVQRNKKHRVEGEPQLHGGGAAAASGSGSSGGGGFAGGGSSGGDRGGSGGADGAGAVEAPPSPPCNAGTRHAGGRPRRIVAQHAPPGSRAVVIGDREWRELHPENVFSGYSLECKYHQGCVRDCAFGKKLNMSPVECRRRLLKWEESGASLTGTMEDMVKNHRKLGASKLLADFAEQA